MPGSAVAVESAVWDWPEPFVYPIEVSAQAIDEMGHVNNAVYVTWLQEAARAHASSLGLDFTLYRSLDRAMVVRQHRIDYLQPAFAGEQLQLATWVLACDGRLSIERGFQLCREGVTLLRAHTRFVCIELSSGRPRRLPEPMLAAYRAASRDDSP